MSNAKRSEGQPIDRLTRLADAMTRALEADPEYHDDDKAIIFLDDDKHGGIVLFGYDEDFDAMANLFVHLKAVFEANGKTLMIVPVGDG
jgi:hypothetical protein